MYSNKISYSMKITLLSSLDQVIQNGITLMGSNPNDTQYMIWENYVSSVISTISQHTDYSIYSDYLSFKILMINLKTFDKVKLTCDKLMQIYTRVSSISTI